MVTGLEPGEHYVLGLAEHADGSGSVEPLAAFMTNPAGSAIVNATGVDPADRAGAAGQSMLVAAWHWAIAAGPKRHPGAGERSGMSG